MPILARQKVAMLNSIRRFFYTVVATGLSLLSGSAWCAASVQPIENFTKPPLLSNVKLSPSGERMAVIVFNKEGRRMLATVNLNPISAIKVVGPWTSP
jgi:hypothetical protein